MPCSEDDRLKGCSAIASTMLPVEIPSTPSDPIAQLAAASSEQRTKPRAPSSCHATLEPPPESLHKSESGDADDASHAVVVRTHVETLPSADFVGWKKRNKGMKGNTALQRIILGAGGCDSKDIFTPSVGM